jgi:hypothetical protein
MRLIPLTQGQFAKVDDADFEWLTQSKWCARWDKQAKCFYAVRADWSSGKCRIEYMHRTIVGATGKQRTDHRNHGAFGNTLDNQRLNLRTCTHAQNMCNRFASRRNKSGFKGVCWDRSRSQWSAEIRHNRTRVHLGRYSGDAAGRIAAAKAYNAAAVRYHGEFARLNVFQEAA